MKLKDGKKALQSMGIWGGVGLILLGGVQGLVLHQWDDAAQSIAEGIGIIGVRRALPAKHGAMGTDQQN